MSAAHRSRHCILFSADSFFDIPFKLFIASSHVDIIRFLFVSFSSILSTGFFFVGQAHLLGSLQGVLWMRHEEPLSFLYMLGAARWGVMSYKRLEDISRWIGTHLLRHTILSITSAHERGFPSASFYAYLPW
jgi:hypothetical protein